MRTLKSTLLIVALLTGCGGTEEELMDEEVDISEDEARSRGLSCLLSVSARPTQISGAPAKTPPLAFVPPPTQSKRVPFVSATDCAYGHEAEIDELRTKYCAGRRGITFFAERAPRNHYPDPPLRTTRGVCP